jgi:hypothetical protein
MWALHNPTAFPDLCRLHPKYVEMEAAHKAKKKQGGAGGKEPTAADIQLSQAMAAIQESGSEESFEEWRRRQTLRWIWPILLYFILGREGVTPTKVALLMMPLVIYLILGGVMTTMTMMGIKLLLTIIVGEGEVMALTWIEPLLVQRLLLFEMAPPKEPPEAKEYIMGATRRERETGSMEWTLGENPDDAHPTYGSYKVGQLRDE